MRTRAKQKFVAKATALGARVPRAELFVLFRKVLRQNVPFAVGKSVLKSLRNKCKKYDRKKKHILRYCDKAKSIIFAKNGEKWKIVSGFLKLSDNRKWT